MDSEERHELKQNDLLEFLQNFRNWWDRHGTNTLLTILVVIAALVGWNWWAGRNTRQLEAAWSAYAFAQSPEALQEVANRFNDSAVAGVALVTAADQLRHEIMYARGMSEDAESNVPQVADDEPISEAEQNKLLRAEALCQRAIEAGHGADGPSLVVLNARMSLAAVYEMLGRYAEGEEAEAHFDQAREQYGLVQQEAGQYRTIAHQAEYQAAQVSALRTPIEFPEGPATTAGGEAEPPAPQAAAPGEEAGESTTVTP
jgi:hypothetical protein